MYYPEELIEEIRVSNDIVDIIQANINLTRKGNSYFGLCPFHNEKTPSFSVSKEKQMFHCFGCGASGNVITFVMEYENYSFLEAIEFLADRVNITLPQPEISEEMQKALNYKQRLLDANRQAAKYFYAQLKSNRGKNATKYIDERGLDEDTRKKFGLGYSNFFRDDLLNYLLSLKFSREELMDSGLISRNLEKNEYYDRFFNRVMFPIFDIHNRVVGFGGRVLGDGNPKYLNSPETQLFEKSRLLYGMNLARTSRKQNIILVEGYMDVIALHQAGFDNAVASLGTAFTTGQANLIKRYADEVVISYDSDNAGVKAAIRAIPILELTGLIVKVIAIPNGKDPDEFIQKFGNEAFEKLIAGAKPSFIFEIEQLETQHNLEDPDSKTTFYHKIAEKLVKMSNEIKRDNYFELIVKKYGIKESALQNEMASIGKNVGIVANRQQANNGMKKDRLSKDAIDLAQRNLITFIVSHKDIYEAVKNYVEPKEFTDEAYRKLSEMIFEAYGKGESINPPALVNKFTELNEQNKIANIFNNNIELANQMQFEKMVNESVRIIKQAYIDDKSRHISGVDEMQDLIKKKKQLQGLYISLNHG